MGFKSEKQDFFSQFFPIFTEGVLAKLNELESESGTLAQNGLESAKFLITVPHYNFCIVHCDQGVCISYVADIVHFGKAVGQQQQQVQQQICPSWTSVYQSDRLWFVQAAEQYIVML